MSFVFENVSKQFLNQNESTLQRINLEIQTGEFVCIVGKSGCGKSTLLNLAAGLLTPSSGRILLDGSEWSGSGEDCHVSGTRFVSVAYRERKCGIWYEISRSIERKTSGKIGLLFENGTPSRVRGLSSP